MIKENLTDIEVKYVFVRNFEWNDTNFQEIYQSHPRKGHVYRNLYNKHTSNHKIHIQGPIDALLFDKLESKTEAYSSDMVEITKGNILNLNIPEKQLDQLLVWMESKNEDIKGLFQEREEIPMNIQNNLAVAINQAMQDEHRFVNEAANTLADLHQVNSIQAEIVLHIARALTELNVGAEDEIRFNDNLGMGNNISSALRDIQTYYSTDRRTNEDPEDLMCAITHLIDEINRVYLNQE
jgi:hypothetical protein